MKCATCHAVAGDRIARGVRNEEYWWDQAFTRDYLLVGPHTFMNTQATIDAGVLEVLTYPVLGTAFHRLGPTLEQVFDAAEETKTAPHNGRQLTKTQSRVLQYHS
jgi:hypothetical protein